MDSSFLGAYWTGRAEDRGQCASRISAFLRAAGAAHASLGPWFRKASRKSAAFKPVDISPAGIESLLTTNNSDVSGQPILDLGFSLGIWNGDNAGFSVTIGATSPYIKNAAVLSFEGVPSFNSATWLRLIGCAVEALEPDSAVVTSHDYIARHGGGMPDQVGGWFTYKRGEPITELPGEKE